ncbi:anosmin-1-like isoform X1 [Haliotis cracherodii]|uniref:anosmin-1-like isoform X1 n=1 Tax=Haliotis cracherodii TaxID=6455 RepID=UPI0039EA7424
MKGSCFGGITLVLGVIGVISDSQHILWGQCYSNCLTRHLDIAQSSDTAKDGSFNLIRKCQKIRDCKTCLFVCDRSPGNNYTSNESCRHDCDVSIGEKYPNYASCRRSCRFLARAAQSKVGTCPSKKTMSGFKAACVPECTHDADCAGSNKCCDNGCGFTCQGPRNDRGLPKKPSNITFETRKDGGVVISWDLPGGKWMRHAARPFVYVVRWRTLSGKGVNFKVTDRKFLKLRGIVPASTLNVIVAAVNIHGSKGFTSVSKHTKEFMKPSPPANFEEGSSTVHDGKVDVEIMWQPPRQLDGLPVDRYIVMRSEGLPQYSANYQRVNMLKYKLQSNKHKFVLRNLQPGSRYFVQVYATVRWRNRIQKGRMASMYIVTYSPPTQACCDHVTQKPWISDNSVVYNITVDQSFYHSGVLKTRIEWRTVTEERLEKYIVFWRAVSCDHVGDRRKFRPAELSATTHDQEFNLYNLHYSCNYTVQVRPINAFGEELAASVASFSTPHCVDIKVRGKIRPECPRKVTILPGRPPDIQIHHLVYRCSVDVEIVWQQPVWSGVTTGYTVLWGKSQVVPPTSRQVVYSKNPEERIISGNITELILTGLNEERHYSVQISARSSSKEGDKSVKHFTTLRKDEYCMHTSTQATHTDSTTTVPSRETKNPTHAAVACRPAGTTARESSLPTCSGSRALIGWSFVLSLILSFMLL